MSELVPLKQKLVEMRALMQRQAGEIAKAVPRGIDPIRFARTALTLFATKPKLLDCTPQSVMGAMMQAAAYGLELDPGLAQAYLVPYGKTCQLIIGYQGLCTLAMRAPDVKSVVARAVYAKDTFEYELGLTERLVHKPSTEVEKGELVYVYAVAKLVDRDGLVPVFEVMSRQEVDKIRARSRAANDGPWVTDYEMMARKTGVRRLSKWLPKSTELQAVLAREDRIDAVGQGATAGIDELVEEVMQIPALETTAATPGVGGGDTKPPAALDQLTEKLEKGPPRKLAKEMTQPAQTAKGDAKLPGPKVVKPLHDPRPEHPPTPSARDLARQEQLSRHEVPRAHQPALTADDIDFGKPDKPKGREPGEEG